MTARAPKGFAVPPKTLLLLTIPALTISSAANAQDTAAPADASTTTTVVVVAPKADIVKKIDKTVYTPGNNPKAANGTAQDVLQSTPGVSVSNDGALSIKGNGNVTLLIDGHPSAEMSGATRAVALQTMAGSDIASVEVITNPSAAYNANGGAIINIVLKPNRKPGGHVTLRGSVSDQGLWNSTLAADYTSGPLSLHASFALRHDGSLKLRSSDIDWTNPMTGETGENIATSRIFIHRVTENAAVGADYNLDVQSTLSAEATWHYRHSRPFFDEFHEDYDDGLLQDIYHRISDGPNQQSDDQFSLNYSRQDHDALLKASLQHSDTFTLVDKSYDNVPVVPAGGTTFAYISGKTLHRLDEASLDYTTPVTTALELGVGVDLRHDLDGIGNYFANIDPLTGAAQVDAQATNRYRADTTQAAAYVTAQVTAGSWQTLAGLRLESLTMRLLSDGAPAMNGPRYVTLDPSLHLKYTLNATQDLTLSYRQSLERPDPGDLDPRLTYVDAQNLASGNPLLKPQALKSLELGFDDDTETLDRSVGLFYRQSTDTVVDSRTFTTGDVLLTSKQNGGQGVSAGATASAEWKPTADFHINGDASLYSVHLVTPDLDGPVTQDAVSYQANLDLDYHRGIDDFSFDAHVQGPGISPERKQSASTTLNFAWQRQLTKQLSVTLNANDMLDGSKTSFVVRTATFDQRGYNHFEVRRVYIGFVYKPD